MNVTQLVNYAWILTGVVARDLEEVSGSQAADGLFWLNQILSEIAITGRYIPYYSYIQVPLVVGQEQYFLPNVVEIDTANFYIDTVRYMMLQDNRRHYFGAPRVDNVNALPYQYYWERVVGGSNIFLYFPPQGNYLMKVKCLQMLSDVTEMTNLDLTYDKFYQSFLMYMLASRLADWYKIALPPATQTQLSAFMKNVANLNPMDLTCYKTCTYSTTNSLSYAQANIGRGFVPPV